VALLRAKPHGDGVKATSGIVLEANGSCRPACVVEAVVIYQ
jgi:hypothetical protein